MDQEAVNFKLLTVEEVALLLRISKPTIYRWTADRKINHYKAGARILFSEQHIQDYLEHNTVPADSSKRN